MVKDLVRRKSELESTIQKCKDEIKIINAHLRVTREEDPQYPWTDRAFKCVVLSNEFLSTVDILESLFPSKDLAFEIKRRKLLVALSVALINLCRKGKLVKQSVPGVKGNYYGLPAWVNETLGVKPEYQFKLNARINQKKQINKYSKKHFGRFSEKNNAD